MRGCAHRRFWASQRAVAYGSSETTEAAAFRRVRALNMARASSQGPYASLAAAWAARGHGERVSNRDLTVQVSMACSVRNNLGIGAPGPRLIDYYFWERRPIDIASGLAETEPGYSLGA